jgi:elongation factor Ts
VLAREKAILAEKNAGKPAHVLEKIVESGLKSYAKEQCLLDQVYIHDGAKSVAQVLKESEGKVGGPVSITGFARFALGEGIEKEETDFAAEVAAAAGGQA